ncbi:MAG TPA: hypothetical protein VE860_12980, partial [Chthoniobacterales bacterium]|nr:hypothetical protein [Chthoniobacterales bacterium]
QATLQITESERAHRCTACGVPYATQEDDEGCPVCLLRRAMQPAATVQDQFDEGRFDHYEIVRRDDGCFLFQVTLELGANPYRQRFIHKFPELADRLEQLVQSNLPIFDGFTHPILHNPALKIDSASER